MSPRRPRPGADAGTAKADGRTTDTSQRIVAAALRLFAERGYDATSVADIEAAVGLTPGAGALYRHFRSKRDVLAAAVRSAADDTAAQIASGPPPGTADMPLPEQLTVMARLGLDKLRAERDLSRVIFRDLDHFPDLLAEVAEGDVQRTYLAFADWLRHNGADASADWDALAAVLAGAVSNYWTVSELFGSPPAGVSEDRFIAAWVTVVSIIVTSATVSSDR
jgi:AcrR family transcriptional regulator